MDESAIKRLVDLPPAAVRNAYKSTMIGLCTTFKGSRTFTFDGREYPYLYHPYNLAWRNERSVEVPIARAALEGFEPGEILEVGNVLSHYCAIEHEVLDKYEAGPGVINEDAAEFDTPKRYRLVISISTLEHVGEDAAVRDPARPLAAVENLRRLLAPGGLLLATAPVGLNADFDRLLEPGGPFDELAALLRKGGTNRWGEAPVDSVLGLAYGRKTFRARAIVVCRMHKGREER